MQIVHDESARRALVRELATSDESVNLAFVNQHAINLAWDDVDFRQDLLAADVLLRDGIGFKAMLCLMRRPHGLNLNGTDLIPELLSETTSERLAIYGTEQPYLDIAAERLDAQGTARVVSSIDGFHADQTYVDDALTTQPSIIVLGMGMPKQERVARQLTATLDTPSLVISGGAILDFIAGRVTRAPMWIQRLGLEWLFRLSLEPRRLWSRYGPGGVRFLQRVLHLRSVAAGDTADSIRNQRPGSDT